MFRILSRYLVPEANTGKIGISMGKIVELQSLLEVIDDVNNTPLSNL